MSLTSPTLLLGNKKNYIILLGLKCHRSEILCNHNFKCQTIPMTVYYTTSSYVRYSKTLHTCLIKNLNERLQNPIQMNTVSFYLACAMSPHIFHPSSFDTGLEWALTQIFTICFCNILVCALHYYFFFLLHMSSQERELTVEWWNSWPLFFWLRHLLCLCSYNMS